ncbi:glycosyl hydrolases family 38 N-terminal domain-domain-containing protein [Kockovaella imperatae]|uniref:Alpha-mannosidase n=1 Tax=Kockovaella imperatae TaxID=4999 RepID=A0A1Y1UKR5_9TREE|nr:glycosyl hydrolases family 38 N-terminal domain-domain-containing protein [Kockovaella imperatae]ORX38066.1 glycosyl hydrolases family 38 N-terminal domain-domain-containing protein [Kockovaella imperatae]
MGETTYPDTEYGARYKNLPDVALRLNTFLGGGYNGQYSSFNLTSKLDLYRLDDKEHVRIELWSAPGLTKPIFAEASKQTYRPSAKGECFGPAWSNHWFRVTLDIPPGWRELERVQLDWDSSGEALVYSESGEAIQGLSGDSARFQRNEFVIPQRHRCSGSVTYLIEASCSGMVGETHNGRFSLRVADLVAPNMEAWRLKWDFETLKEIYEYCPDTVLGQRCLTIASRAMKAFKRGRPEQIAAARTAISDWIMQPGRHRSKSSEHSSTWALGHCHIDTANLWTYSVTQQKSARSWSSQLRLMEEFPAYNFTVTQAQQLKWVENLYPELFHRLKLQALRGRFQVIGATWVEMDTNIPSGESLCRQFLHGQRYFESRFGQRCTTFALPDSFGFSSQLPQIARLSGATNFYTQKMSWNLTNHFPHTSFNWIGLDGSQLLSHMSPTELYSSTCSIPEICMNITNHGNADVAADSIFLFGHGDGGGGPINWMLERLSRVQAVAEGCEAGGLLPTIKIDGSFDEFYETLREKTNNGMALPTWHGEMYLERHRACQTSQARIKRSNRKLEILIREVELLATLASIRDTDFHYPATALESIWERILLNQFHDVIAGTAFGRVYTEVEQMNEALFQELDQILQQACKAISAGQSVMVAFNSLPWLSRREVCSYDGHQTVFASTPESGHILARPIQWQDLVLPATVIHSGDEITISTSTIAIVLQGGRITSLVDIAQARELIPTGQSGGLSLYIDIPHDYDAWEVESYTLDDEEQLEFTDLEIVENSPLRTVITARAAVGEHSTATCRISIDNIAPSTRPDARHMIRFDAEVEWHDHHQLLCFTLPLNINSDYATYDSQFGFNKRPTHRNTSWDAAKFEVCAHTFADLSEYGYGVALLNDCKYGYTVRGNVMRLSLLRGPTEPDLECDMGHHQFSWAIYPHVGLYHQSDVADVAAAFNAPMRVVSAMSDGSSFAAPPFEMPIRLESSKSIAISAVKRGQDDHHTEAFTIIMRLYERFGGHAKAKLRISNLRVLKAELVNILEEKLAEVPLRQEGDGYHLDLLFGSFELVTVKLYLDL